MGDISGRIMNQAECIVREREEEINRSARERERERVNERSLFTFRRPWPMVGVWECGGGRLRNSAMRSAARLARCQPTAAG